MQANYPNEIIHMDLTDMPEVIKNGKDINLDKKSKIAVVVDNLTKFAYELITSKMAKDVLPVLMRYINIKGCPKILLTDNGTEFVNGLFKDYLNSNNIEHRNTRPYNPQCNGIAERFIKTLKDLLSKEYINNINFNIRVSLEKCLYEYNHKIHKSTNFKPIILFNSTKKEDWLIALNNISKIRKRNEKNANPFKKNDKVLVCKIFVLKK